MFMVSNYNKDFTHEGKFSKLCSSLYLVIILNANTQKLVDEVQQSKISHNSKQEVNLNSNGQNACIMGD